MYLLCFIQEEILQKPVWLRLNSWCWFPALFSPPAFLVSAVTGPLLGQVWGLSLGESLSHQLHSCQNGFSWQKRRQQAWFQRKILWQMCYFAFFKMACFVRNTSSQHLLTAFDLEESPLMWIADLRSEVLPLGVHCFKAKWKIRAIFIIS